MPAKTTTALPSNARKAATARAKEAKLAAILHTPEDLSRAVSEYSLLEMTVESLQLEADAELSAIKERYALKIEARQAEMADLLPQIETYTRAHRADLFKGESKTAEVAGHELSLRMTPPKVDTARGFTQKGVLASLIEHPDPDFADRFIRWTESLNKEAILDAHDITTGKWKPGNEALGELGLEVTQAEQFTLKTRRTLGGGNLTQGTAEAA